MLTCNRILEVLLHHFFNFHVIMQSTFPECTCVCICVGRACAYVWVCGFVRWSEHRFTSCTGLHAPSHTHTHTHMYGIDLWPRKTDIQIHLMHAPTRTFIHTQTHLWYRPLALKNRHTKERLCGQLEIVPCLTIGCWGGRGRR